MRFSLFIITTIGEAQGLGGHRGLGPQQRTKLPYGALEQPCCLFCCNKDCEQMHMLSARFMGRKRHGMRENPAGYECTRVT